MLRVLDEGEWHGRVIACREGSLWKELQTLRCRRDAIFTVLSVVVMDWKYRDVEDLR